MRFKKDWLPNVIGMWSFGSFLGLGAWITGDIANGQAIGPAVPMLLTAFGTGGVCCLLCVNDLIELTFWEDFKAQAKKRAISYAKEAASNFMNHLKR